MRINESLLSISTRDINGYIQCRSLDWCGKDFPDSFQIPCRIWAAIKSLPEFSTRKSKRGRPAFADEKLKLRAILWNCYSGDSLETTAHAFGLSERMLNYQIEKWKENGFFHKLTLLDYNSIFGRNSIKDWNWMVRVEDYFSTDSHHYSHTRKVIARSTTEYKLPSGFKSWDEVFILSLKAVGVENAYLLIEEYRDENNTEIHIPTIRFE